MKEWGSSKVRIVLKHSHCPKQNSKNIQSRNGHNFTIITASECFSRWLTIATFAQFPELKLSVPKGRYRKCALLGLVRLK